MKKEMEDLDEEVRMLSLFGMAVTVLECERVNERRLKGDREDKLPPPAGQNVTMATASTNNRLYQDLPLGSESLPPPDPNKLNPIGQQETIMVPGVRQAGKVTYGVDGTPEELEESVKGLF